MTCQAYKWTNKMENNLQMREVHLKLNKENEKLIAKEFSCHPQINMFPNHSQFQGSEAKW